MIENLTLKTHTRFNAAMGEAKVESMNQNRGLNISMKSLQLNQKDASLLEQGNLGRGFRERS